ncbi:STT3 domain-containing protein [Wolinella succinogenes]|uniref:PUTATIVE INTEGRAL MEMBRANE PROTEIN POSSIBLE OLIGOSACCHARYLTRANSFERASE n=1 Tax=Wolinella succinogenes (strain ATCC 29543 / DSM 1740 / CCUG 13145 / JCM 31913 / LMG 7466 / NCTC 11488 / FDC 602W) TaxID=273121 RepID=Q7MAT3_WOLSU|nr:STT3 domain-containing protein [Wolinella succinogenes]CAE09214.1 PUTATIVE INTEGRAL MEMBRANE PROTEIN POSSIBLE OLIGOSACCHARYLTRANSFERASE [Wolinella succinogenes]VEG81426.1 Ribosomal protein L29 [Wolinella succinogenes]HCZ19576.1 hypothetical protein [Helicobacter sp.]
MKPQPLSSPPHRGQASLDIGLALLLFLFALGARLAWVVDFGAYEEFLHKGILMINTNDGYYYAEGARDLIAGFHQENDLSPLHTPLSLLTAWLYHLTPFSLEALLLGMPLFFGASIVFPLYLLGKELASRNVGFFGALLGGVAVSYYNRTMAGYYDTDMLVLVLPLWMFYFLFKFLKEPRALFWILSVLFGIASVLWHNGLANLYVGVFLIGILYLLFFEESNPKRWHALSLILLLCLPNPSFLQIGVVILLGFWIAQTPSLNPSLAPWFTLALLIWVLFGGALSPLWYQLEVYLFRPSVEASAPSLHFYSVVQTIREASTLSLEKLAIRISGHPLSFGLALLGYLLLAFKRPLFWLTLPFVALGFLGMKSGLRFTLFAVPFMALSLGFLIESILAQIPQKLWRFPLFALATLLALWPNLNHILDYQIPPVFKAKEVHLLETFKGIANREDYVMAWWDYGYGLRYYSDVKTLIDGAKHAGNINYPVSYALLSQNALASANMARLSVEFTERSFEEGWNGDEVVAKIMEHYGFSDPNAFLEALSQDALPLPPKSREIYYYLPLKMMEILPTVDLFSHLDLSTGHSKESGFFFYTQNFIDQKDFIDLGRGLRIDKTEGILEFQSGERVALREFIITQEEEGEVHSKSLKLDSAAPLYAVYMKNQRAIFLADEHYFHSLFIQLFALGDYDSTLFEPILSSPWAKIYKLKR